MQKYTAESNLDETNTVLEYVSSLLFSSVFVHYVSTPWHHFSQRGLESFKDISLLQKLVEPRKMKMSDRHFAQVRSSRSFDDFG